MGEQVPHAILETERCSELPLWAQVLLASRLLRRGVLELPHDAGATPQMTAALLAGCDALDRCARTGQHLPSEYSATTRASVGSFPSGMQALVTSMEWAIDAAMAAEASLDFSAAESACCHSAWNAIASASASPGMNPIQAKIYIASDIDLLRFACAESKLGRYDGLGDVMGRLTSIG